MSYITINTVVDVDVDVDLDELFSTKKGRKEIFEYLIDEGYVPENSIITKEGHLEYPGIKDGYDDIDRALAILSNHSWKLTKEESDIIENISNKYKYL